MGKKSFFVFVIISSLMFSLFPSVSFAQFARYWVQAYDQSGHFWGVYGLNFVMVNPTIDVQHVNAVAVMRVDGRSYVELGWYANRLKTGGDPTFFLERKRYGEGTLGVDFEKPTPGTEHSFLTHWERGTPNNEWHFLIDGVLKYIVSMPEPYGLSNGWVVGNSERVTLKDTNYGRFWYLQKADPYQNWSWWGNMQPRPYYNNDPEYEYVRDSNTAFRSLKLGR